MSLLDTVEPDGFARYVETYPVEGRVFIRFSTTTDGWADRLCEPFYKRSKVESLLQAKDDLYEENKRLRAEVDSLKEENFSLKGPRPLSESPRKIIADLTQQLAAANGRVSSWWAALMEAAGCLEQAAMSMRDEDAKRAALGAAEHARNDAHRLAALSDLPEADKEKS